MTDTTQTSVYQKPSWDADHYSAELGNFVLHIYRQVRRRKPNASVATATIETGPKLVPYEYYRWCVLNSAGENREAGRGVAATRDLAETACMAVVRAAQGLPDTAIPKVTVLEPYDQE
jgi:hypothetical protein